MHLLGMQKRHSGRWETLMQADRPYTVGHSNRDGQTLLRMLRGHDIGALVDIRSSPSSRRHPQLNRELLHGDLERQGVVYHWAGRQLGGLRRAGSPHVALPAGRGGYADHMEGERFCVAVTQLLELAAHSATAEMCAERDPADCHRSLLADYLIALHGVTVVHVLDTDSRFTHRHRPELRVGADRRLVYDRQIQSRLEFSE